MSIGTLLLTITAILVFCGLLQRVLDRMYLTDRQALLIVGLMLIGTILPSMTFGAVSISLGGAVIPIGICIYLLIKADEAVERRRALIGVVLTGGAVYMLSVLLPEEAEAMLVEPMWLYGLCGGLIAWLLGRSRRAAFICGVAGVLLSDVINAVVILLQGYQTQLHLGGAGIADASVISGVVAVAMCELLGETIERFVRSHQRKGVKQT